MSYSPPKLYLGEIVDINDPLKEGRAKIRVFGLFDGLEDEDIPWASQVNYVSFSGKGNGAISIPRVGTVVALEFDGQNYYRFYYYAEWETNPDLLEEISDSYEGAHSLIYDSESTPGPLKIFYTQKKGLNLILGDAKIQLDTQDGGQLRVVIEMGQDQIRMENNKVIINSNNIELGEAAIESVIKGNTFQTYFNSHTHIGNLGGPTSPPVIPSDPTHLSNVSKTR
jgi:hypothetical protein